jgi:hypothetical protein
MTTRLYLQKSREWGEELYNSGVGQNIEYTDSDLMPGEYAYMVAYVAAYCGCDASPVYSQSLV